MLYLASSPVLFANTGLFVFTVTDFLSDDQSNVISFNPESISVVNGEFAASSLSNHWEWITNAFSKSSLSTASLKPNSNLRLAESTAVKLAESLESGASSSNLVPGPVTALSFIFIDIKTCWWMKLLKNGSKVQYWIQISGTYTLKITNPNISTRNPWPNAWLELFRR